MRNEPGAVHLYPLWWYGYCGYNNVSHWELRCRELDGRMRSQLQTYERLHVGSGQGRHRRLRWRPYMYANAVLHLLMLLSPSVSHELCGLLPIACALQSAVKSSFSCRRVRCATRRQAAPRPTRQAYVSQIATAPHARANQSRLARSRRSAACWRRLCHLHRNRRQARP